MARLRAGDRRLDKAMARVRELLTSGIEIDERLSPGQLHAAAVETLGSEPIVFVCNLLALALDATSKIEIQPAEAARIGLMVMDRIYGQPDAKIRKRPANENQFELDFMWATPDGREVHATATGDVR
jgi:hypothetical protein